LTPPPLLLQVPYESLRRTTRERKYGLEEIDFVLKQVKDTSASKNFSSYSAQFMLENCINHLHGLKRKQDIISESECNDLRRCKARLEHLRALGPPPREGYLGWMNERLDRLLVDHLLRHGYHHAAEALISTAHLEDLVDVHIFQGARSALEALQNDHDCTLALQWCEQHRSRLMKMKSSLIFCLRLQQFVELIRSNRLKEAVFHARQHLAPWANDYLKELQHAAGALAFKSDTTCPAYQAVYQEERWTDLSDLFLYELHRLSGLPPLSQLAVHLQAGLSALKTPVAVEDKGCTEDPLHLPAFKTLAQGLPAAKHVHSKLVCGLSKRLMDEDNPPMAFPNGYVYGKNALVEMAGGDGGSGKVVCPNTGYTCQFSDLRRVYIS
jgi:macrophage erythroblast attacher